ncbi:redoxin domain-containing protein [Chthonomonas calidirosea]|uniref:Thiol-disulfide isomerase and thioredoxins n=1 Tax=Chthonomonas calidirosea (strain DSM 23976 / ICMP 18418 / T49) TaxID=1303518 RepID=S0EUE5_CHTCT|nr:redoxin domain-containing protein [Chthonomonas calidirosea]CCW34909.1 Thiol-disulfide isomerase and thioredoxins [Chthonomonas calidirosea T49]CEK12522.1 thiol-disulfide isomerase-like thioredoxin [Chthonomonas calidirosea]CEK13445.1 thiol-disulfide isomerase-like thioredoxin [Chthonomonas calidirosea]
MKTYHRLFVGLIGALCSLAPLRAAKADSALQNVRPDVAAVLKAATSAYDKLQAYEHTETWTLHSGDQKTTSAVTKLAFKRPNRFYIQTSSDGDLLVSDGQNLYIYRKAVQEYTKDAAPISLAKSDDLLGALPGNRFVSVLVVLIVQHNLDKASSFLSLATLAPPTSYHGQRCDDVVVKAGNTAIHLYFNKQTHLLAGAYLKHDTESVTEELSDVHTNGAVPNDLFTFTPPSDAKLVADLDDPEELALQQKYVGKPAVDFSLQDTKGKTWDIAELKGKVVIVDFWASWCGPCQMVMPTIEKIYEKYSDKDVVVLAVNTWDDPDACASFLKKHPEYKMNVLLDPAGKNAADSVATKLYGVQGIPTTLFIDKEGIVRTYAIGAHPPEFYMDQLKKLGIATD